MQSKLDFAEASNKRIADLMIRAEKYTVYGQSYNRHIATSYHNLKRSKGRGHTPKLLDHLADELELRLDYWIPKMESAQTT